VRFDPALAEWEQVLCFSPETSGGLLLALASDRAQAAQEEARARGQELWDIGEVSDHEGIEVVLSL
jgi:selenide,water dikinase